MKFKFRKPRLRISKSGKPSISGAGLSFGNKNARVNLSKSGVSGTVGAKGQSYNTKRGWNCGFVMLFFVAAGAMGTVGAAHFLLG